MPLSECAGKGQTSAKPSALVLLKTLLCTLLLATVPDLARAGVVSVTPTLVSLTPGKTTELISLTNESDQPSRFEITANKWTETEDGRTELMPASDIVVFPPLVEIPAHDTKKIRLGVERISGASEQSYRLIAQELPRMRGADAQVQIQVLTKFSVPIFVVPTQTRAEAAVLDASFDQNVLSFTIANPGSAHFVLQRVDVLGEGGAKPFTVTQKGWYILPGGKRTYHVFLGAEACRDAKSLLIKAVGDGPSAETRVAMPASACGHGVTRFIETARSDAPTP